MPFILTNVGNMWLFEKSSRFYSWFDFVTRYWLCVSRYVSGLVRNFRICFKYKFQHQPPSFTLSISRHRSFKESESWSDFKLCFHLSIRVLTDAPRNNCKTLRGQLSTATYCYYLPLTTTHSSYYRSQHLHRHTRHVLCWGSHIPLFVCP